MCAGPAPAARRHSRARAGKATRYWGSRAGGTLALAPSLVAGAGTAAISRSAGSMCAGLPPPCRRGGPPVETAGTGSLKPAVPGPAAPRPSGRLRGTRSHRLGNDPLEFGDRRRSAPVVDEDAARALPEMGMFQLVVDEDVAVLRMIALVDRITVRVCVPGKCSAAQRIFCGAAQLPRGYR